MRRRELIKAGAASLVAAPEFVMAAAPSVVVAELFTSEGCSSCPPADALLLELARSANVVAVAWHVDYWNNLGWRDPYARVDWTRRQQYYANLLNSEVFTPALVINGSRVVVGSDRAAVTDALRGAISPSVPTELRRSGTGLAGSVAARPEAASVSLVVYDSVRATSVRAGENSGRVLREGHIVRSAEPVDVPAGGGGITFPGLPPDQGAVLMVQHRGGAIVGVAEVRPASETQP